MTDTELLDWLEREWTKWRYRTWFDRLDGSGSIISTKPNHGHPLFQVYTWGIGPTAWRESLRDAIEEAAVEAKAKATGVPTVR